MESAHLNQFRSHFKCEVCRRCGYISHVLNTFQSYPIPGGKLCLKKNTVGGGKDENQTKTMNKKNTVNDSQVAKAGARKETQRGNPSHTVQKQVFLTNKEL